MADSRVASSSDPTSHILPVLSESPPQLPADSPLNGPPPALASSPKERLRGLADIEAKAKANGNGNGHGEGNGNGSVPHSGPTALPTLNTMTRRPADLGSVSPRSHGAGTPSSRTDGLQPSPLSRDFPVTQEHATALSSALRDSSPARSSVRTSPPHASGSLPSSPQTTTSLSPRAPLHPSEALGRRLSTDRRVRSEALPEHRRHMSMTGRRPSVLTGGYESSSEEDDDDKHGRSAQGQKRRRGANGVGGAATSTATGSFGGGQYASGSGPSPFPDALSGSAQAARAHLAGGTTRRRAHSLMAPPNLDLSSQQQPSTPARRLSRLRPPSTGSPLMRAGSGAASPSGSGTYRVASDASGFHPPPSHASSSRVASMRSLRTTGDEQRREKRRSAKQPVETKRNQLADSLGLGVAPRQAVLSPDQIQNLLGDVDVSSAMQLMAKPMRRQSSIVEPGGAAANQLQPQQQLPPTHSHPYLVSAPPPLTNGEWAGRVRDASVSSSIAPQPQRNVTPAGPSRRQRTMSMESDGGHVPFTHHLPLNVPPQAIESDIEETDEASHAHDAPPDTDTRAAPADPGHANGAASPAMSGTPKKEKERKRISQLFGLRKKAAAPDSPQRTATSPVRYRTTSPQPIQPPAPSIQQQDRAAEMRRVEAERRQEELAQERRYRAMLQVHAHPNAQRRAQHVATHLDALYSLIYLGIEQPPKVNPLAVIRWVDRTEQQREARRKWEESQREGSEHLADPSLMLAPTRFHSRHSGHSGSSGGLVDSRFHINTPQNSRSNTTLPHFARGWHYDIDGIQAYRAANGKVDYFVPPAPVVQEERAETPEPDTQDISQWGREELINGSERSFARGHSVDRSHISPSVISSNADDRPNGAAAISSMASPSMPSLLGSGDQPLTATGAALTPSRSNDAAGAPKRASFRTHRAHQSASGIPPKPLQSLRVPFERAKDTLRRGVTTPTPTFTPSSHAHLPSSDFEDLERRTPAHAERHTPAQAERHAHIHAFSPGPSTAPAGKQFSVPHHIRDMPQGAQSLYSHTLRGSNPLRRRRHQDTPGTSDDEQHRVRGLIARGARGTRDMLYPRRPLLPGHGDLGERVEIGGAPADESSSRSLGIGNLEQGFARDQSVREAQARDAARKAGLEEQRAQQIDDEIYAQREDLLVTTTRKLEQAEQMNSQMQYSLTHYLTQLDQVQQVFKSAADMDMHFTGLEELRNPAPLESSVLDDDEEADSLAPLKVDSDRGYFSTTGTSRPRRAPRRHQSLPQVYLPSFAHGLTAWPRRSTLDPTLGITTDPLHRVELSCAKARKTLTSMGEERAAAHRTMQDMVSTINSFIEQKDLVRAWTKAANERLGQLREERINISTKIKGGLRPRVWRLTDTATDFLARWVMGLVRFAIRIARAVTWVRSVETALLAWGIVAVLTGMLVFFFLHGREETLAYARAVAAQGVAGVGGAATQVASAASAASSAIASRSSDVKHALQHGL